MQEMQEIPALVRSVRWEMATHFSILAWKFPWPGEPGGLYSPQGHKQLDMTVDTYKKKKGLGRTRSLAFIEHLLHAECWAQGFIYMIPLGLVRGI